MPTLGEEDPFEYRFSGESGKQKTMTGYRFAGMSPTSPEFEETLGPAIEDLRRDLRPVSDYRRSIYPTQPIPASTLEQHPDLLPLPLQPEHPMATPIRPTFRGLFALSTRRDIVLDLLPAVLLAGAASVVQPFMSLVIGDLFQDFEDYPLITTAATSTQRDTLTSLTTTSCIKLLVAGGYAVLINYLKGVMWARHGETIVSRLREAVFVGVQNKPMEWFDLGMGLKDEDETSESIGAGGLMAKFTK
jgi:ATP-binding cassette subfamily B (MDR/TAP) protein 1